MSPAWIGLLVCLAIVGGSAGEGENKTDDIDKVNEAILEKYDYHYGEDSGSASSNVKLKEHRYEDKRKRKKGKTAMLDEQQEYQDPERGIIGNGGKDRKNETRKNEKRKNKKVKEEAGIPHVTKHVPQQKANPRRQKVNGNMKIQNKKKFRVDTNSECWKKRPKVLNNQSYQGHRKTNGNKHGYYAKRYRIYKTNRNTKIGKITALKKIGKRKKFNKAKQKAKIRNNKEKKKKKGSYYGSYTRKYSKYIFNKKVRFRSRNGFRRKQTGRASNRKGGKIKSWCPLNKYGIPIRFLQQFMNAFVYNQRRRKQKLQRCRRREWYRAWFGAVRGYRKWEHCLRIQRRKSVNKTGGYGRKRKPIKCGKQQYVSTKELCCKGNLYKKLNDVNCCGKYLYNITSQFCWNNTIFNSSTHSLCNSAVYNHLKKFCYNGSLYDKNGRYEICCKNLYDRMTYFCYKCKIYPKCCSSRCGNEIYNVKFKFCYHDCLFDRYVYDVCDGRVISRSKYKCVDSVIKIIHHTKLNNIASKKQELQGNNEHVAGNKIKMVGKRDTNSACKEMIYN